MSNRKLSVIACLCALFALPAFAGVTVTSPGNGASVGSPVHFVASGSSPACSKGVAALGIYTAPSQLAYKVNGAKLYTYLSMNTGIYSVVFQQWDNCSWINKVSFAMTVG